MEDVVPTPVTVIVVLHEPSVVVSEPPLVVPDLIFDFAKETMGEHDNTAQSLGSMGVRDETEKSIDDRIQVIPLCTLHTISVFGQCFVHLFERTSHIESVVMWFVFLAF